MNYTTRQMLESLQERGADVAGEVRALEREQATARADLQKLKDEVEQAWAHLTSVLVPGLDFAQLDASAARIRLRSVGADAVRVMLADETRRVDDGIAQIRADERWSRREEVANEASIRMDELHEAMKALRESMALLEGELLFEELIRASYGVEGYAHRFWQVSYYRHWKHADIVVERHGKRLGVADFAGVRTKYLAEQAALESLRAEHEAWRQKSETGRALDEKLRMLTADKGTVAQRTIARVRGQVREHLSALDNAELGRMFAHDEELRIAAARVGGSQAKRAYLEQLLKELIDASLTDLRAALAKNARSMDKLRRPKNAHRSWTGSEFGTLMNGARKTSWAKRRQRIQDARTHIVSFHHYDRWSPATDFLWWDAISDGRIDGDFIPEVRDRDVHHHHHDHAHDRAAVASSTSRDDLVRDIS